MIHFLIKTLEFAHTYNNDGKSYFCNSHCHNTYELYLLISGDVDYTIGDKTFSLNPLDILVIPPATFHCPHIKKNGSYERIIFNFKPSDINKDLRSLLNNLGPCYSVKHHSFFRSIATEFTESLQKLSKEYFLRITKNLIEVILIELSLQSPREEKPTSKNPIFFEILKYIDNNLDKKLSQESMSKKFYVTPSWINYSFKKHFNVNCSQYIKTKKMTYAQDLLQSGNPPKVVSVMCGFDVYTTFLRQYKSFFKHFPTDDYIECT